jgi:hypothetical protein
MFVREHLEVERTGYLLGNVGEGKANLKTNLLLETLKDFSIDNFIYVYFFNIIGLD